MQAPFLLSESGRPLTDVRIAMCLQHLFDSFPKRSKYVRFEFHLLPFSHLFSIKLPFNNNSIYAYFFSGSPLYHLRACLFCCPSYPSNSPPPQSPPPKKKHQATVPRGWTRSARVRVPSFWVSSRWQLFWEPPTLCLEILDARPSARPGRSPPNLDPRAKWEGRRKRRSLRWLVKVVCLFVCFFAMEKQTRKKPRGLQKVAWEKGESETMNWVYFCKKNIWVKHAFLAGISIVFFISYNINSKQDLVEPFWKWFPY